MALGTSSQPTIAAEPYWTALIAVLGTIVGATISAITQTLTNRRSSVNQMLAIQVQLDHAAREAIRQDRRRTYARFLLLAQRWDRLCSDVYIAVTNGDDPPVTDDPREELMACYSELDLLADEHLGRMAFTYLNEELRLMRHALDGEDPEELSKTEGQITPSALTAAMQKELGIAGIPVNPKTGWRIWAPDHRSYESQYAETEDESS